MAEPAEQTRPDRPAFGSDATPSRPYARGTFPASLSVRTTVHAQELLREIDRSIDALAAALRRGHSEEFRAYLRVMARFHRYSSRNVWLILRQRPGARLVAGHVRWRSLGRVVRRGERGIAILAPTTARRLDPETGREESTVEGFHVARVWDVAQTDGRPLPDYIGAGIEGHLDPALLERALRSAPLPVRFVALRGDGETDGREIRLAEGLPPSRTLVALAHEWAHVLLHLRPEGGGEDLPSEARELEAEATAYVVAAHFGIADRSGCDYILSYGGGAEALERRIERIRRAAGAILDRLAAPGRARDPDSGSGVVPEDTPPFVPETRPLGETTGETRTPESGLEKDENVARVRRPLGVARGKARLRGEKHLAVPALGMGTPGEERLFVAAEDGARIGDPGTEGEERRRLTLREELDVGRDFGPRTDEGHASGEDVEELRPLVDLETSEPGSEAGDAGIASDREKRAGSVRAHRAELMKGEGPSAPSETFLTVEDRRAVGEEHRESHEGGREREEGQERAGQERVAPTRPPHRR